MIQDAEQAVNTMNAEWLGTRQIRVNWANQKTMNRRPGGNGGAPTQEDHEPRMTGPMTYENVIQQAPDWNSTVYVGNLAPGVGRK